MITVTLRMALFTLCPSVERTRVAFTLGVSFYLLSPAKVGLTLGQPAEAWPAFEQSGGLVQDDVYEAARTQ